MTKVKICGLSREEDIATANALNLDYIGFLFAKSKREVSPQKAAQLKSKLSPQIEAVGVFVNAPLEHMISLIEAKTIDIIQLHGSETEETILSLKKSLPHTKIIKAVSVTAPEDILPWENSAVDFLLLDKGAGGTGESFDWGILESLRDFKKPYFIAGGLSPKNIDKILPLKPYAVDVSSGVETLGKKDAKKMQDFTKKVRQYKP